MLDTIKWYFSSGGFWYSEGCTPRDEAMPVYLMGPDSYPLAGLASGIYYDNGKSKTLSFYFDPYYIDSREHGVGLVKDVLHFFENPISNDMNSRSGEQTLPVTRE